MGIQTQVPNLFPPTVIGLDVRGFQDPVRLDNLELTDE